MFILPPLLAGSSFVIEAMGELDVWGPATWRISLSKLENLHPVEKYKHILDRWLIMGQDPSIVLRGPFI